jgi:flagellar motor switch protein FliG
MSRAQELSGAERVAAFLLSLDRDAAAKVIGHLDETVVVEIVEAMSRIGSSRTGPAQTRDLTRDLVAALQKPRQARIRSGDELRALLEQTLGKQQATAVFDKIEQRLVQERPFLAIEHEPAANIAKALGDESDAVAALVLAHLDPEMSAEVLSSLPPQRALEAVKRMATLIPPRFDILISIARDLSARLAEIAKEPVAPPSSVRLRTVAEVLNYSAKDIERTVLEGLNQENAAMAAELREFMFTWEDLADLDRRAMQKILATVNARTLAIALKGASAPVEQNILSNLSTRVRDMIKEERELAGPMPMAEIQKVRAEVMTTVRSLLESGDFAPARGGESLVQ